MKAIISFLIKAPDVPNRWQVARSLERQGCEILSTHFQRCDDLVGRVSLEDILKVELAQEEQHER